VIKPNVAPPGFDCHKNRQRDHQFQADGQNICRGEDFNQECDGTGTIGTVLNVPENRHGRDEMNIAEWPEHGYADGSAVVDGQPITEQVACVGQKCHAAQANAVAGRSPETEDNGA